MMWHRDSFQDLMFSELEVFADETGPCHADENSNEENDVDDETMSGEWFFATTAAEIADKPLQSVEMNRLKSTLYQGMACSGCRW